MSRLAEIHTVGGINVLYTGTKDIIDVFVLRNCEAPKRFGIWLGRPECVHAVALARDASSR